MMKTNPGLSPASSGDFADGIETTHPFLADMPDRHVRQLLEHAQVVDFQPEEIIFREGEPADRFFLVESGNVALEVRADGHGIVHIDSVGAGEVFGCSWLFPPFAWRFQARVVEPTRAIVCNGGRLLVLCEDDPAFGYSLMKRISMVLIHRLQSARKELCGVERLLNPPPSPTVIH